MTERPYEGKIIVAQLFFEFSPGDYSHLNIFKKGPKRQIYRSFEEEKKNNNNNNERPSARAKSGSGTDKQGNSSRTRRLLHQDI